MSGVAYSTPQLVLWFTGGFNILVEMKVMVSLEELEETSGEIRKLDRKFHK